MDALMAENGSVWNPSEHVLENVRKEVDGVIEYVATYSLLKPGGVFLYLTFGQPHFRRPHLERENWTIETKVLGDMFHYFLFICKKNT